MKGLIDSYYKGMRVLITGSSGFVGRALTEALLNEGALVAGWDIQNRLLPFTYCDVGHVSQVMDHFEKWKPQIIFHLAAETEVVRSHANPRQFFQTNVNGTFNILEACRRYPVESIVVASSDKAYGHRTISQMPYRENHELLSDGDFYSVTKRLADLLVQDFVRLYDIPAKITRCCNIYGPGQSNASTLITGAITCILRGAPPTIREGSKNTRREWLYISDAIDAYLHLGRTNHPSKRINPAYNIGSGQVFTVAEVIHALMDLTQFKQAPIITPSSCPEIGDQWLDSTRFRQSFKWQPKVSFFDGLRQTIEWHKTL